MAFFHSIAILLVIRLSSVSSMGLSISRGPSNMTILRGGTVRLRCTFLNLEPSSQIMWYRYSGPMITNRRQIIAVPEAGQYMLTGDKTRGEYNLEITNVQSGDTDEYSCGYTESNGDIQSRSAFVTVQTPPNDGFPTCRVTPTDPRIGDNIELVCTSFGGVPSAELTWNRNGVAVTHVKTRRTVWRKLLRIEDMKTTFTCIADSPVEDSPRMCEISVVQETPTVDISPEVIPCFIGDEVDVACTRNDKTSHTDFMWYYNGDHVEDLPDRDRFQVIDNGDILRITRVVKGDANAQIKCQLEIYSGFMKHATALMTVQATDLGDIPSGSPSPGYRNTTYDPEVRATQDDEYPMGGQSSFIFSPLIIMIILICICFISIVVLGLVYLKHVRNQKVDGSGINANGLQTNGRVSAHGRHVYETALPLAPGERSASVPENESVAYHDIDEDCSNMQTRYHNEPMLSPNNHRNVSSTPSSLPVERLYEIPFIDVPTIPKEVSPSEYVEIANNNIGGQACCSKPFLDHNPNRNRKAIDWPPVEKVPQHFKLRPSKSETNLFERTDVKALTRLLNENSSLNNAKVTNERLAKPEQSKQRRISPTSPPPTTLVPRPNHSQNLLTSPDSKDLSNIQKTKIKTGHLEKPKVASKPIIGSPVVPPRPSPNSDPKTIDKDGYVLPKSISTGSIEYQTNIEDTYEYEQVDQVDSFFPNYVRGHNNVAGKATDNSLGQRLTKPANPSTSSTSSAGSAEYRELDRSSMEWSSYQPLSPGLPEARKHSWNDSTSHEYDHPPPSVANVKKLNMEKSDYLEILD